MTSTGTGDPGAPEEYSEERDLRRERSVVTARTRDLVRKLTALADRYDALPALPEPVRARERSARIAVMRSAVASGHRLLESWETCDRAQGEPATPVPAAEGETARTRDAAAARRDDAAELRDQRASLRDRRARAKGADLDPGFADRFLSASERDDAAGDRAAALHDRVLARRERELRTGVVPAEEGQADPSRLLEQLTARATFHQAQGLLMARSGMNASEAFETLLLDAQRRGTSMTEAAARLVHDLVTTNTSELLATRRSPDT